MGQSFFVKLFLFSLITVVFNLEALASPCHAVHRKDSAVVSFVSQQVPDVQTSGEILVRAAWRNLFYRNYSGGASWEIISSGKYSGVQWYILDQMVEIWRRHKEGVEFKFLPGDHPYFHFPGERPRLAVTGDSPGSPIAFNLELINSPEFTYRVAVQTLLHELGHKVRSTKADWWRYQRWELKQGDIESVAALHAESVAPSQFRIRVAEDLEFYVANIFHENMSPAPKEIQERPILGAWVNGETGRNRRFLDLSSVWALYSERLPPAKRSLRVIVNGLEASPIAGKADTYRVEVVVDGRVMREDGLTIVHEDHPRTRLSFDVNIREKVVSGLESRPYHRDLAIPYSFAAVRTYYKSDPYLVAQFGLDMRMASQVREVISLIARVDGKLVEFPYYASSSNPGAWPRPFWRDTRYPRSIKVQGREEVITYFNFVQKLEMMPKEVEVLELVLRIDNFELVRLRPRRQRFYTPFPAAVPRVDRRYQDPDFRYSDQFE